MAPAGTSKAPKRSDLDRWEIVRFLLSRGFRFRTIREEGKRVPYPDTLEAARAFVARYREFAEEPAEVESRNHQGG
jgi:hypothetical protein